MLVELNISVWTANKIDRNATQKVADDNHATSNAAQVRKNLLAGTTLRKELADFAASCRLWHNMKTLPWSDRGPRLLPTSLFFDYKKQMTEREGYFTGRRDAFLTAYPDLVRDAPINLGTLYDPNDYPSVEEVASKFAFRMVFSPVPEGGDFRVDLPAQDIQEMRAQYDAAFNDRLAEAMREPWDRLHKMLTAMTDKLNQPDDPDAKKRWHDTFVTNAQDMTEMLKHLNVTKDPELERARRALSDAIYGIDIEDVKGSPGVREDMSRKLTAILDSSW
jgi:hypothetical protein